MRILADEGRVGPHLSRPDDDGYVEATGERVALLGRRRLEVWMWPLLLLEDLEVRVRRAGEDTPLVPGPRTVHVVPEGLGLAWAQEGFTLWLEAFACRTARGLLLLVSVEGEASVEVDLCFRPAVRPMWPAGLGGQLSGRDPQTGACFLSEELGRFAALVGSPEAEPLAATADRGLRETITLTLPISAARARKGPVPVVIAGAQREPEPLSEAARRGGSQSACGTARADAVIAEARELYRSLCVLWRDELEAQRAHWRAFLERTATLESDDGDLERAFLWSKIAVERCWVSVDGVGRDLVAGLGPSFGGDRPGFAWFFNGDALVASRALAGLGDFEACRQILRCAADTQRADGKIAHEITLSAGLCDWYGDYPYAYYKGQVTPGFVSCLAHYVGLSGDVELARELWPAVQRAIEWSRATCDDAGRMQVPEAGIAAVEAGPLAGRIRCETYLQGIWISALEGAIALTQRLGEVDDRERWTPVLEQAREGLAAFWREDLGRYGFAELEGGERCDDLTAYGALMLSRGSSGGEDRDARAAAQLNRPELTADWGARMFATDSALYDPEHYNTGSVFPYLTNFAVLALFRHRHLEGAWQLLRSQVALDGFDGLGWMPEFLAGDRARVLPRAVPHQVFSQTTILQGVLFGLWRTSLDERAGRLSCAPYLPPGVDRMALRGLRLGASLLDLELQRRCAVHREPKHGAAFDELELRIAQREGPELRVMPVFRLPNASQPVVAECNGSPIGCQGSWDTRLIFDETGRREDAVYDTPLERELRLGLRYISGPILTLPSEVRPGEPSRNPRLVSRAVDMPNGRQRWTLAGPAGTTARLPYHTGFQQRIEGAALEDGQLVVSFPDGEGFTTAEVVLDRIP